MNPLCTICQTHPLEDLPNGYEIATGQYHVLTVLAESVDEPIPHWLCSYHLKEAQDNSRLPEHSIHKYIASVVPVPPDEPWQPQE